MEDNLNETKITEKKADSYSDYMNICRTEVKQI